MRLLSREEIASRTATDIPDGAFVNLGIGIPTLVAKYIPSDREVLLHSENGIVGMRSLHSDEVADWELINVSGEPVGLLPGGCIVSHNESFVLVRGGHIDISIMGAFEVSPTGDLANWTSGKDSIPGVGGAMDLAAGARRVWVAMPFFDRAGSPKLVPKLSYPATALGVVERVYTDVGIFRCSSEGFVVEELAPGVAIEELGPYRWRRSIFKKAGGRAPEATETSREEI